MRRSTRIKVGSEKKVKKSPKVLRTRTKVNGEKVLDTPLTTNISEYAINLIELSSECSDKEDEENTQNNSNCTPLLNKIRKVAQNPKEDVATISSSEELDKLSISKSSQEELPIKSNSVEVEDDLPLSRLEKNSPKQLRKRVDKAKSANTPLLNEIDSKCSSEDELPLSRSQKKNPKQARKGGVQGGTRRRSRRLSKSNDDEVEILSDASTVDFNEETDHDKGNVEVNKGTCSPVKEVDENVNDLNDNDHETVINDTASEIPEEREFSPSRVTNSKNEFEQSENKDVKNHKMEEFVETQIDCSLPVEHENGDEVNEYNHTVISHTQIADTSVEHHHSSSKEPECEDGNKDIENPEKNGVSPQVEDNNCDDKSVKHDEINLGEINELSAKRNATGNCSPVRKIDDDEKLGISEKRNFSSVKEVDHDVVKLIDADGLGNDNTNENDQMSEKEEVGSTSDLCAENDTLEKINEYNTSTEISLEDKTGIVSKRRRTRKKKQSKVENSVNPVDCDIKENSGSILADGKTHTSSKRKRKRGKKESKLQESGNPISCDVEESCKIPLDDEKKRSRKRKRRKKKENSISKDNKSRLILGFDTEKAVDDDNIISNPVDCDSEKNSGSILTDVKTHRSSKRKRKRGKKESKLQKSDGLISCNIEDENKGSTKKKRRKKKEISMSKGKMSRVILGFDTENAVDDDNVISKEKASDINENATEDQKLNSCNPLKFGINRSNFENLGFTKFGSNPLMQTLFDLRKSFPFKEQLIDGFSDLGKKVSSDHDVLCLDSVPLATKTPNSKNELSQLSSELQVPVQVQVYFEVSDTKCGNLDSDTNVKELMRKSVLPDDLEKMEKAPKLFPSKNLMKSESKKKQEETAGKGWYNLPKTEITDKIKKDLQLIKMRNVLDPKHHYKRNDTNKLPKYFQMGTVVEGAHEFYSSRIPQSKRKSTMVDELLEDAEFRRKNKKKYIEIRKKQMSGGKGFYKKLKNKGKATWERT